MDLLIRTLAFAIGLPLIILLIKLAIDQINNFIRYVKYIVELKKLEPELNSIKINEIEIKLLALKKINEEVNLSLAKNFNIKRKRSSQTTINDFLPIRKFPITSRSRKFKKSRSRHS